MRYSWRKSCRVITFLSLVYCLFSSIWHSTQRSLFTKDAIELFLLSRSENSLARSLFSVLESQTDWPGMEFLTFQFELGLLKGWKPQICLSVMAAVKDMGSRRRLVRWRENLESWRESLARGSWRHGLWRYRGNMKPSVIRVFPWAGRFRRLSWYFCWLRLHTDWSQLCSQQAT